MWTENFTHSIKSIFAGRKINEIFLDKLKSQLPIDIENKIGLNPLNVHNFISLTIDSYYDGYAGKYIYKGDINKEIPVKLCAGIVGFPSILKWKSKSGKFYTPTSESIDLDDIEFWIEGLDKEKILQVWNDPAYNPKTLGFKHKKTHFKLDIEYFHYNSFYLIVFLKEEENDNDYLTEISNNINEIFMQHNIKSEKQNRKYGLIHDFGPEEIKNNKLIYYIDYGSANDKPLKAVIDKLNTLEKIEKVVLTGQKE